MAKGLVKEEAHHKVFSDLTEELSLMLSQSEPMALTLCCPCGLLEALTTLTSLHLCPIIVKLALTGDNSYALLQIITLA